jgi:hypothetical protein
LLCRKWGILKTHFEFIFKESELDLLGLQNSNYGHLKPAKCLGSFGGGGLQGVTLVQQTGALLPQM